MAEDRRTLTAHLVSTARMVSEEATAVGMVYRIVTECLPVETVTMVVVIMGDLAQTAGGTAMPGETVSVAVNHLARTGHRRMDSVETEVQELVDRPAATEHLVEETDSVVEATEPARMGLAVAHRAATARQKVGMASVAAEADLRRVSMDLLEETEETVVAVDDRRAVTEHLTETGVVHQVATEHPTETGVVHRVATEHLTETGVVHRVVTERLTETEVDHRAATEHLTETGVVHRVTTEHLTETGVVHRVVTEHPTETEVDHRVYMDHRAEMEIMVVEMDIHQVDQVVTEVATHQVDQVVMEVATHLEVRVGMVDILLEVQVAMADILLEVQVEMVDILLEVQVEMVDILQEVQVEMVDIRLVVQVEMVDIPLVVLVVMVAILLEVLVVMAEATAAILLDRVAMEVMAAMEKMKVT